jgi:hypothetical protein
LPEFAAFIVRHTSAASISAFPRHHVAGSGDASEHTATVVADVACPIRATPPHQKSAKMVIAELPFFAADVFAFDYVEPLTCRQPRRDRPAPPSTRRASRDASTTQDGRRTQKSPERRYRLGPIRIQRMSRIYAPSLLQRRDKARPAFIHFRFRARRLSPPQRSFFSARFFRHAPFFSSPTALRFTNQPRDPFFVRRC